MDGIRLWVDDLRNPEAFKAEGWVWVKTITEAVRILSRQHVSEVSLDHDICHAILPGDPGEKTSNIFQPATCPENYTAVAHFIAMMPPELRPEKVYVHTANEVGSGEIHNILRGKVELERRRL